MKDTLYFFLSETPIEFRMAFRQSSSRLPLISPQHSRQIGSILYQKVFDSFNQAVPLARGPNGEGYDAGKLLEIPFVALTALAAWYHPRKPVQLHHSITAFTSQKSGSNPFAIHSPFILLGSAHCAQDDGEAIEFHS